MKLRDAGVPLATHQVLRGLEPDFFIPTAEGGGIVVEVKNWPATPEHIRRAEKLARLVQKETGARNAYVIIPGKRGSAPDDRALGEDELVQKLQEQVKIGEIRAPEAARGLAPEDAEETPTVFAAMPFNETFDDVYHVAITHAAAAVSASCIRVDLVEFTGDISSVIQQLIANSVAMIADLSGANPNVLYELGYAHALRKPAVTITSSPLTDLPFDVRNMNTLSYTSGKTHALRDPLARRLSSITKHGASGRSG